MGSSAGRVGPFYLAKAPADQILQVPSLAFPRAVGLFTFVSYSVSHPRICICRMFRTDLLSGRLPKRTALLSSPLLLVPLSFSLSLSLYFSLNAITDNLQASLASHIIRLTAGSVSTLTLSCTR